MSREWYRIESKSEFETADLYIFDQIGKSWWNDDAVSAKKFIDDLKALPAHVKTLRVHVNSPGGDPFDGSAIANALREQGRSGRNVETIVDGLAASAASIVIMGGQTIKMSDNALIMIHDPQGLALGNAQNLRKLADTLDKVRDSIVATYRWHSNLSDEELRAFMAEETWFDADEAIERGFATEKVEGLKAAAAIDPKSLAQLSIPEKYRDRVKAFLKPEPVPEPAPPKPEAKAVVKACKAAGLPELADELLEESTLETVNAKLQQAKEAKAAAEARTNAIRALCKAHKVEDRADEYVRAGVSVEFVKNELTWVTAKLDGIEIDGHIDPDAKTDKAFNVFDIYRDMKQLPAAKGA